MRSLESMPKFHLQRLSMICRNHWSPGDIHAQILMCADIAYSFVEREALSLLDVYPLNLSIGDIAANLRDYDHAGVVPVTPTAARVKKWILAGSTS
eukprot:9281970-Karenia_brevis.AAC.1